MAGRKRIVPQDGIFDFSSGMVSSKSIVPSKIPDTGCELIKNGYIDEGGTIIKESGYSQISELGYIDVTATVSGKTVTGTSTVWTENALQGDVFMFESGVKYNITEIASNTSL